MRYTLLAPPLASVAAPFGATEIDAVPGALQLLRTESAAATTHAHAMPPRPRRLRPL
jgi:hypothetical protein